MCEKTPLASIESNEASLAASSVDNVNLSENVKWLRENKRLSPLYERAKTEHFISLIEIFDWLSGDGVKYSLFDFAIQRSYGHLLKAFGKPGIRIGREEFDQLLYELSNDVMEVFDGMLEDLSEFDIVEATARVDGGREAGKRKLTHLQKLLISAANNQWPSIAATSVIDSLAMFISGTAGIKMHEVKRKRSLVLANDIKQPNGSEEMEREESIVDRYPDTSLLTMEEKLSQKQHMEKHSERRRAEVARAQRFEERERERLRRAFLAGTARYSENMFDAVLDYAQINLSRDGVGNYGVAEEVAGRHDLKKTQLENYLEALRGAEGKWARYMARDPLPWDHDGTFGPLDLPNFKVKTDGTSTEDRAHAEFKSRDGWSFK